MYLKELHYILGIRFFCQSTQGQFAAGILARSNATVNKTKEKFVTTLPSSKFFVKACFNCHQLYHFMSECISRNLHINVKEEDIEDNVGDDLNELNDMISNFENVLINFF